MIKMAYFFILFLSPLTALAMGNTDSGNGGSNNEFVGADNDYLECEEIANCDEANDWASYLLSMGENVVDSSSKVIKFAVQHPQLG